MSDPKENMSFYRNKKALATEGRSKHLIEYDIISDDIDEEDDIRIIRLKKTDKTEHLNRCEELAKLMVEKLGEGDNKLLRKMLLDTLRDYIDNDIIDMLNKVKEKDEPVKHREGCFKLIIGDGRKKGHHEIMLIE